MKTANKIWNSQIDGRLQLGIIHVMLPETRYQFFRQYFLHCLHPVNFKHSSFYLAVERGCSAKCELIPSIRILPTSFLSRDTSTIYLSFIQNANLPDKTPWRNGSASDSRSEVCVFKSRRGQSQPFLYDNGFI